MTLFVVENTIISISVLALLSKESEPKVYYSVASRSYVEKKRYQVRMGKNILVL